MNGRKAKTLADLQCRADVLARLRGVCPDTARGWGRMTPHQMVCRYQEGDVT